jgi:rfaE bifunctional protein kinase chain/domain
MSVKQIIQSFKELKVLIVGDVMIDSYLWGNTNRVSPEAPVPIVNVLKQEHRMGGAANVALNIMSLGAEPIMLSVIGKDEMGSIYLDLLNNRNMSNVGIIQSENRITSQKTRVISHNQHVVRIDNESAVALKKKDEDLLIHRLHEVLSSQKIDVVILEDYNKGVLTPRVIKEVIAAAREKNIPSAVDPKKDNFFAYKYVTLFKPNLKEFIEGLKLNSIPESKKNWLRAIEKLRSLLSHEYTFVTLSEEGVLIEGKGEIDFIPAHVRNIADVSGAGDTVISVAALCLALNTSPTFLASLANLAGGLVCEESGVVPINPDLLLEEALREGL